MAGFNQCETLFEIELTPNKLREIAAEIERLSKGDLFLPGQVVRYKLNHRFALVYRPEYRVSGLLFETKSDVLEDEDLPEV